MAVTSAPVYEPSHHATPLLYRYVMTYQYPFGKVVGLDGLSHTDQEAYFEDHGQVRPYQCTEELLVRRHAAGKALHRRFVELGGALRTLAPHYFTLGSADEFFYGTMSYQGSLAIPLDDLDGSCVSFTIGDSVPIFDEQAWDGEPKDRRLYTSDNLDELLDVCDSLKGGAVAPYFVEAQVWSDGVADAYSPPAVVSSLGEATSHVDRMSKAILLAGTKYVRAGAVPGIQLAELLRVTRESAFLRQCVRHAERNLYFSSPMHGFEHCFNTALLAVYMASDQQLASEERDAAILGALYHDVGRSADGADAVHGEASASILGRRVAGIDSKVLSLAQAAAHAHCMPAQGVDDTLLRYVPSELLPPARRVAAVVRTADARSRCRPSSSWT